MISCGLCGSNKTSVIRDNLRYGIKRNVLRCGACGYVFLEPKNISEAFYKDDSRYRKTYGPVLGEASDSQAIFDIYYPYQAPIALQIKNLLNKKASVLDIGCSTGHFLQFIRGKVKTVVGLELNQKHAEFAAKKLGIKVYSDPIEKAAIAESPFDLVTCLQTLEHVDEPLPFLLALRKHIKKNGHLFLEVPNVNDALISIYHQSGYEDFYFREPHVSYFSPATLELLLSKAGFKGKIKTVQRYNVLNHINWLLNGVPQKDFRMGNSDPVFAGEKSGNKRAVSELNRLLLKFDRDYKRILAKHEVAEVLSFVGSNK